MRVSTPWKYLCTTLSRRSFPSPRRRRSLCNRVGDVSASVGARGRISRFGSLADRRAVAEDDVARAAADAQSERAAGEKALAPRARSCSVPEQKHGNER